MNKVDMGKWLLLKFNELKYFELDESAFEVRRCDMGHGVSVDYCVEYMEDMERCMELAKKKWSSREQGIEGKTLRFMEDVFSTYDRRNDERYRNVLHESFFSKESLSFSAKEYAQNNYIGLSRVYGIRAAAEDSYVHELIRRAEREGFDIEKAYRSIRERYDRHLPGGTFYEDSLDVLKKYRKVKFGSVEERMKESSVFTCDVSGNDILSRWMNSSMMEKTFVELLLTEEAVEKMKSLGNTGKRYAEMIHVMFMDERYEGMSVEERIEVLGMTERVFYADRKKAVTMFSKVLWGTSGYRHS